MSNPNPDRHRIEMIEYALDANTVHELVTSHGLSLIKNCLCFLADIRSNEDKALLIDFCVRHGGLTPSNMRRVLPGFLGGQRTNHCGGCGRLGHQSGHCAW